jgi:pimeloyl-ACP methyl ester carboxylesterase
MIKRHHLLFTKALLLVIAILSLCALVAGQTANKETARREDANTCGNELHCEVRGSGKPLLFLHGFGANIHTWDKLLPLQRNFKLILVDLKGAGESPKPHDKDYGIQKQADLVYEIICKLDLQDLTIVGNSYGGGVSLLLAIRLCAEKPNRLSSLILLDPGAYKKYLPLHLTILKPPLLGQFILGVLGSKRAAKLVLRQAYYDDKKITQEQVENYARPFDLPGGRYALVQTARQVIPPNMKEIECKYPTISVPTLILWGREDKIMPLIVGKLLHKAIPHSQLDIMCHTGHAPQEERPEATIPRIEAFLETIHTSREARKIP